MPEWRRLDSPETPRTPRGSKRPSTGDFTAILQEVLVDEDRCEAFIDWMYREFCSEVILSFFEFVQFRNYVKEEMKKTAGDIVHEDVHNFDFYEGMPKSTIIHDPSRLHPLATRPSFHDNVSSLSTVIESGANAKEHILTRCKKIAHLFYRKYIMHHHAEHEINISGTLKARYLRMEPEECNGMELEECVTVYDEIIAEMMKYQSQSFRRFERSNQ